MLMIAIVCAGFSVLFFSGKCNYLITEYNRKVREGRRKYHEKKFTRFLGIGFAVLSALLLFYFLLQVNRVFVFQPLIVIFIVLAVLAIMILPVFLCREKGSDGDVEKRPSTSPFFVMIFTCAILLSATIFLTTGKINIRLENNELNIKPSYWSGTEIAVSEIESVQLEKNIDIGKRTSGLGTLKLQAGNFQNDDYGSYKLYSYVNANEYVVIKTENKTVLLGLNTPEETELLFTQLETKIKENEKAVTS